MLIDQVAIDIEEEKVKVIDSVTQECELQSSQSPHKKHKKSHIAQVDPDGVVVGTKSVQVVAQTDDAQQKDQVTMHIEQEEVKVGMCFVEEDNRFLTMLRMTQHNKPKKSHIGKVTPKDYMCTKEDNDLIEYLKLAPEKKVLVNIDGAWLDRKDMECMFHDNMQFNGEVLSAYIHCIRDEKHLLHREGRKVFLENTYICSLLERDGDPKVALSHKIDNINERVQNYLEADMVFLPINIKKSHWYLAVVRAELRELKGLERQIKFALEHNKDLNRNKWKNLDFSTWPVIEKIQEPMQKDGTSCGLWMVNFMEYWTGSSMSDEITQDDINHFRFKLPAILWYSRLNIKNVYQEPEQPAGDKDIPSDVKVIDTTANVPKPSTRIFMDRNEGLHRLSTYIWSIDDKGFLDKEWVRSTTPYPISISLKTIRDILDANKPMDHDCFNLAIRTVACNIARFFIEEKYHFMDLQFCDISQIGRDPRCRDEVDYRKLRKLLECWPGLDYYNTIKDCSTVLLPCCLDKLYSLFIIDRRNRTVYIMDPVAPTLRYTGKDRTMPYIIVLRDIAKHFILAMKLIPRTLRMEFLLDILNSHANECENFPEDLKDLLKQFKNYL
uniref:Peptidase_C48 n=1 Tax=Oryza australiensis TaxID=4532 RepID=G8JB82_9ORYZ|nr:Peptidase_C48 [Oryza australiensis]